MPDICFCGTPQLHHNKVVPCEPAWTFTVVLTVELFITPSQRRRSCFCFRLIVRSNDLLTLPFQTWRRKRQRGECLAAAELVWRLRWLWRLWWTQQWRNTGAAEGLHMPPGYADPWAFRREGVGGRGQPWTRFGFPGGRLPPINIDWEWRGCDSLAGHHWIAWWSHQAPCCRSCHSDFHCLPEILWGRGRQQLCCHSCGAVLRVHFHGP